MAGSGRHFAPWSQRTILRMRVKGGRRKLSGARLLVAGAVVAFLMVALVVAGGGFSKDNLLPAIAAVIPIGLLALISFLEDDVAWIAKFGRMLGLAIGALAGLAFAALGSGFSAIALVLAGLVGGVLGFTYREWLRFI